MRSASTESASSESPNTIGLAASRTVARSGTTTAGATASRESSAMAVVAGTDDNGFDPAMATVGCSEEPITAEMSASVSAPAKSDEAYAFTALYPEAHAGMNPFIQEYRTYASNELVAASAANRPSECCVSGDMVLALSEVTEAVWDAVATYEPAQVPVTWEVCLSGATGLTRDGDPEIATVPGFAAGATSVNRNGMLASFDGAFQEALPTWMRL